MTAAEKELSLSSNSSDSIAAEAAKVAAAQAILNEDTLRSPIDGVVTQEDPNVGEFIAAGNSGFAVQSNGNFKIRRTWRKPTLPKSPSEIWLRRLSTAYGSDVDFEAKVISIDPAETVLEGVPTYKVTLVFVSPDSRILSGMTANLIILTHEKDNVLEIPYRAVIDNAGIEDSPIGERRR